MKRRIDHRVIRKRVIENNGIKITCCFDTVPRDEYVYIHKKETDGEVFYVGRGKGARYRSDTRNKFWNKTAKKYGCVVEIVAQGLLTHEAKLLEKTLVNYYGRRDLGLGTLTNLTDGGDGGLGVIVSEETRKKLSEANTGLKNGNADLTIYHFKNYKTNEEEFSNKFDFENKYSINAASLFNKGCVNTIRGWYAVDVMTENQLAGILANFKGKHNPNSDKNTYTFVHVKTKEEFKGTRFEFKDKYNLDVQHLFGENKLFKSKTTHGWTVLELFDAEHLKFILNGRVRLTDDQLTKKVDKSSGTNNPNHIKTIYKFYNLLTEEIIECTRVEMSKIVPKISWLFTDKDALYIKDWCLFENIAKVLGPRNGGKDYNKYVFTSDDDKILITTRSEFKRLTGIDTGVMFRSKTSSNRGWSFKPQ